MIDRKEWIVKRKQIPMRAEKNEAIAQRILPFLHQAQCAALYYPVRQEADIFSYCTKGRDYALPRVLDDQNMKFYPAENLAPGAFGIPEPQGDQEIVPDVIVVPMLCFCDGYRVGYGKGYYDRYLSSHPQCLRVGIAYDEQEGIFTPQAWDERLDVIVTPTRVLRYKR